MDERAMIQKTLDENPDIDPALRTLLQEKLNPKPLLMTETDEDQNKIDDEIVILCGYWPSVINGSKLVLCGECKTRCSIAPSTQENLKGHTARVRMLCIECFEKNPPPEAAEMLKLLKAVKKPTPVNPFQAR